MAEVRVQFNSNRREITLKVVYYGPPLSGKTTNLESIHAQLDPGARGRLMTLNTADDRTLFFDLLPVTFKTKDDYRLILKLFTVPGQVIHATTRKLVLQDADGVVFIADSQLNEAHHNSEFWNGMRRYLLENGLKPDEIPSVIQFNKRDLPNIRTDEELEKISTRSKKPIYKAVAVRGEGVLETLYGLLVLLLEHLNARHDFQKKFLLSQDEFLCRVFGQETATNLAGSILVQQGEDT